MGWVSSTTEAFDFRVNGSALPMYALFVVCVVILVIGIRRRLRELDLGEAGAGRPESRAGRYRRLVELALLQRRIVGRDHPRWTHLPIFWGFVALALGSLAILVDVYALRPLGLAPARGLGYRVFQAVLDLFGVLFVLGVALAIYRRVRVRRGSARLDDGALGALWVLLGIGLSGFVLEGLRLRVEGTVEPWAFAGSAFASLIGLTPASTDGAMLLYRVLWWAHAVAAFGLLASIPYSSLRHLFTSPLHIAFSTERPSGALSTPFNLKQLLQAGRFDLKVGAGSAEELPAYDRLGLSACAGSGACREVCPAHAAGTPLDPLRLVGDLRAGGDRPEEDAIWSCTLCGACAGACPVLVDPTRLVVELRRGLVATNRLGKKRTEVLANLARARNPFGLNGATRQDLAADLGVPGASDLHDVDMVYWVGCAATFDSRCRAIAAATVGILRRAGVRCGVLGPEEACCGDPARRIGEEGMFQDLAFRNIESLERAGVRSLVTHCAHCFNTLRNEYAALGASFDVIHHAELIRNLLDGGAIEPARSMPERVTLHDPCYVGRFNDGVGPPRQALRSIPGARIAEMDRSGERSFCCGAGGANYWYDVPRRETMGAERRREAEATGAGVLVTECPYCLKVLEGAGDGMEKTQSMQVLDIAEWVAASLDEEERA